MGSRKQHLDKTGIVVKTGDKCIYTHPVVWERPKGEFHGELWWDRKMCCYFIIGEGTRYVVNFTYAGRNRDQCDYLVKVVEEVDEPLTPEEVKELSISWPEFEYIEEPDLIADELEEGL